MPIEISGVQGYEYQYLVTLYLALQFIEYDNLKVFIEDVEDARIEYDENGDHYTLYLQSKAHTGQIEFNEFCEWISHFGERQANSFLLSRIVNNTNSFAVFISDDRCKDEISCFIKNSKFNEPAAFPINTSYIQNLKIQLNTVYKDGTGIAISRSDFIQNFLQSISNSTIKNALHRISILERLDSSEANEKIRKHLNERLMIRLSDVDSVIEKLLQCIKHGRDNGIDISNDIKNILLEFRQRILPIETNYIFCSEEQAYINNLRQDNVLLLSGVPFCGKTYLAKYIAQIFAQEGYSVYQTNEFNGDLGAFNFLNNYNDDKRLLILEDPFGSTEVKGNKAELLALARKLVNENNSNNKKIIITSRKDIVLALFEKRMLNECNIQRYIWRDRTLSSLEFARKYWNSVYGCDEKSKICFDRVLQWINDNNLGVFLEIGEINNLFKQYNEISFILESNLGEVIQNARISSDIVVEKILGWGERETYVYVALGLCCNTIRAVSIKDLAFVLSESDETPGIVPNNEYGIDFLDESEFDQEQESRFPQYDQNYSIHERHIPVLRKFESYGYITRDRLSGNILFTHPIFRYASMVLYMKELTLSWDISAILKLSKLALSALNKSVNLCALEVLCFTYERHSEHQNHILQLLFYAINSIFPATKDRVILKLEGYFNNFEFEDKSKLIKSIGSYGRIYWNGNEPWNDLTSHKSEPFSWETPSPSLTIDEMLTSLREEKSISAKSIYETLQYERDILPIEILNYAMTYDEAIIREKAAYLIFRDYAHSNGTLHQYLLEFDNYNVVFKIFRGALESWFQYKKSERTVIIDYYKKNLTRVSVAKKSKRFLENFSDSYKTESLTWERYSECEQNELWLLWAEIFQIFCITFPVEFINMNEPHMDHEMTIAMKSIDDEDVKLDLMAAWIAWMLNKGRYSTPGDYGMSVMGTLLEYTEPENEKRTLIFQQMMQHLNTSMLTSHIHHAIDNWTRLNEAQRNLLLETLISDRKDVKWLQAVAITRRLVPSEIQIAIIGEEIFQKTSSEIITVLESHNILEQCINVHCGYPQPLWWNGYHHNNKKRWDSIIEEIIKHSSINRTFMIALREFIDCTYNYDQRFLMEQDSLLKHLLRDDLKRKATFEILLHVTITQTQTNKSLWDEYWKYATNEEKEQDYDSIVKVIELVEYYQDGDFGIFDIFERDMVFQNLYPRLESDCKINKLCDVTYSLYNIANQIFVEENLSAKINEISLTFKTVILATYKEQPPRMSLTRGIIKIVLKKLNINDDEIFKILENHRTRIIDNIGDIRDAINDEYELENWNK